MNSYHVAIAAEAFATGLFAMNGYDVSVQYGANQPEYDLIVTKGDKFLKVSVKGSQDGSWGLTQTYLTKASKLYKQKALYHKAIDMWQENHSPKTIFCLVQFKGVDVDKLPKVYLATPKEIADRLKDTANGRGDTILYEHHEWGKMAYAAGTVERIPDAWKFSPKRVGELFLAI